LEVTVIIYFRYRTKRVDSAKIDLMAIHVTVGVGDKAGLRKAMHGVAVHGLQRYEEIPAGAGGND
jgi:hypothetical protein